MGNRRSPHSGHAISVESRINPYDPERFNHGLGDQQSVEGIAVVVRQRCDMEGYGVASFVNRGPSVGS